VIWPVIPFFPEPEPDPAERQGRVKPAKRQKTGPFLKVAADFSVDLSAYRATGERDAILASSGMGKSYLTGVILEETLENGGLVCIIDPEGEHHTLAERYPMLLVGGDHGVLPLTLDAGVEGRIATILKTVLNDGVSVVFDVSDFIETMQLNLYAIIAEELFKAEETFRRKIRLVVEEAQIFAPQQGGGQAQSLQISQNIAKRGRKRALDSIWATQRPASLNKNILSQCNRFWFGGINAEQDYKAIHTFLNEAGISCEQVRALQPGEFYCFTQGRTIRLKVRKRFCKHGGATPEVMEDRPLATKKDVRILVERLQ
jgi:uncharacterized protein